MPKKIMAANWKMYKSWEQARQTAREIIVGVGRSLPRDREVLIIPPFTALRGVGEMLAGQDGYFLGAQNFYPAEQGAFTGEISPGQLRDAGCTHALVGHSERRHVLGEVDEFLAEKTAFGLENGLKIIFCTGEKIQERRQNMVEDVLTSQLEIGLGKIDKNVSPQDLIIAYEPVWAIGTGETARQEDIADAHQLIRKQLMKILGQGHEVRILYGGSVKPDNCSSIIGLDNVDGVLVGGASLKADSFLRIVLA